MLVADSYTDSTSFTAFQYDSATVFWLQKLGICHRLAHGNTSQVCEEAVSSPRGRSLLSRLYPGSSGVSVRAQGMHAESEGSLGPSWALLALLMGGWQPKSPSPGQELTSSSQASAW